MGELQLVIVVAGLVLLLLLGAVLLLAWLRRNVNRSVALVVHRVGHAEVCFTDRLVFPVLQRAETIDLSVRSLEVDCRGKEGLVCRDHIRADIKVSYYIRVNHTAEDVLKVADTVGCARATDPEVLRDLFVPRFTEALKSVGAQLEFEEVCRKRDEFKDQLIAVSYTHLTLPTSDLV